MTAALLGGNEINIAGAMVTPVGFRVIEFGEGKAHVTVDFLVSSKCEDERRGRIARRIHDEPS